MTRVRSIRFVKTSACGNDFLLVAEDDVQLAGIEARARVARALCDRREGVGADGLIFYRGAEPRFEMMLYNSDGSPAEVSGNGLRCLAAYLRFRGRAARPELEVQTGAGLLSLIELERAGARFRFRANMGPPRRIERGIHLKVGGRSLDVTEVSMGNPHAVLFMSDVERENLREIGPLLEVHPHFPEKTNVEIVAAFSGNAIRARIWERGVGETASSGTGAAASAVASLSKGLVESPVRVEMPGGSLEVEWRDGENVYLTGEAVVVAEGDFLYLGERERARAEP